MLQKIKLPFIFLLLFKSFTLLAQTSPNYTINSLYSRIGVGDITPEGSVRNFSMGGTGISHQNPEFLNIINPALLINNRISRYDSLYAILDGIMKLEYRSNSDVFSKQTSGSIDFASFAYAFPFSKRWVSAVNLRQYSNVSYSLSTSSNINGTTDSAAVSFNGRGGIYRMDFSNAYKVNKNLSVGLSSSYLFGTIHHESLSQLFNQAAAIVGTDQTFSYSGFLFRPGFVYRTRLNKNIHQDTAVFVNLGVSYDIYADMKSKNELNIERRTSDNLVINRFTASSFVKSVTFPPTLRAGLSFDKFSNWLIALDFTWAQWKNFNNLDRGDTLKNSYTIALGAEKAVGFVKESRFAGYKTKYVRVGLAYTKSPIFLHGKQLNDYSFSLGYAFPVGSVNTFGSRLRVPRPKVNLGVIAGVRGTTADDLVKDVYLKGFIGLTINDKWFKRRRLE